MENKKVNSEILSDIIDYGESLINKLNEQKTLLANDLTAKGVKGVTELDNLTKLVEEVIKLKVIPGLQIPVGGFNGGVYARDGEANIRIHSHSVAIVDDILYMIAGKRYSSNNYTNSKLVASYNLKTHEAIKKVGEVPAIVNDSKAVAVNKIIYVIFGTNSVSEKTGNIFKYDTLTNTSSKSTATSTGKRTRSSAVYDGKLIYIYGGDTDPTTNCKGEMVKFDPLTETLTKVGNYYDPWFGELLAYNDNLLYYVGGSNTNVVGFSGNMKFDKILNTFTNIKQIPVQQGRVAGIIYNNNIYLLTNGTTKIYNIINDTWADVGDVSPGYGSMASCNYKDNMYITGGVTGHFDTDNTSVYAYIPPIK